MTLKFNGDFFVEIYIYGKICMKSPSVIFMCIANRQTNRETDGQTNRQTDRQTEGRTERRADRR